MTRVLPLPGPARTRTGPFVVVTACRCGRFSPVKRAWCSFISILSPLHRFVCLIARKDSSILKDRMVFQESQGEMAPALWSLTFQCRLDVPLHEINNILDFEGFGDI